MIQLYRHSNLFFFVQLHEFQAQPLPSFSPPLLPLSSKCLTEPAPFNLSTENRGAVKAEKWGQKVSPRDRTVLFLCD